MKVCFIDFKDSFTYNLVSLFQELGCRVECCSKIDEDCDLLVLGPGPGRPEDHPDLLNYLKKYYKTLPMIGICLGHQMLAALFGANIIELDVPTHGKIDWIHHRKKLFLDLPTPFKSVRYHSLVVQKLPPQLELEAWTTHHEIMAFTHKRYPIIGIQFHFESAAALDSKILLSNVLDSLLQEKTFS